MKIPEDWEFQYYLKRGKHRPGVSKAIIFSDDPDVPGFVTEAGPAYRTPEGKEVIVCGGNWYADGEERVYEYESGRASDEDGWVLD